MKKLKELYPIDSDIEIKGICINSKEIKKGDLFVCTMGVSVDRHLFVEEAVENGAVAVVASKKVEVDVPVIYVEDTNLEFHRLCAEFSSHPEKKLTLIGITGTNGKTTIAQIIQDLLGNNVCGYIGSNGILWKNKKEKTQNTTPDAHLLFPYLRRFKDDGCQYVSMEVSSEALYRDRVHNLDFTVSIFTNIGQDHLNIHKTMQHYIDSKCQLFQKTKKDGFCILNRDDAYFKTFEKASNGTVLTYGKNKNANLQILDIHLYLDHTDFTFIYQDKKYEVQSPLIGEYNVSNLAAALLALHCFGYEMEELIARISRIQTIEGRMEFLNFGQDYSIILDYAHNPEALKQTLSFLEKVKTKRLITVTGSAGGRDQEKRPSMGKEVLNRSDFAVFTTDDPRFENVDEIIDDLLKDTNKTNYKRIIDREEAIFYALSIAQKDDIVLLAGKGRDPYMAMGKEYIPYDEYKVVKKYFESKEK